MALLDHAVPYLYLVRAEFSRQGDEEAWNRWYDQEHVVDLLSVPGFMGVTRLKERGAERRYLAIYELASPDVFDEPRYAEVTGWGRWKPFITETRKGVYQLIDDRATSAR